MAVKKKYMRVDSYFVPSGQDPFKQVAWDERVSRVSDREGRVLLELPRIEAPEKWSQLAVDIAASKYMRPQFGETSIKQMIGRVVRAISKAGEQQGVLSVGRSSARFQTELTHLLLTQKAAFNSPVWFNVGLRSAFGVEGGSGLFRFDVKKRKVVPVDKAYEFPQTAACFIQSVEDDLTSIFTLAKHEAKIFKYGSGSGTNFSTLRAQGEPLEAGGESSGVISFLEVLDRGAGATKSGGTARRAAKMVCLDMDHPEILKFIHWKVREERKAQVLIKAGYDGSLDGEAYHTVSGQNANNSVRVTDGFIQALAEGGEWVTSFRTSGERASVYSARELWRELAQAAWECADPGVQFHDTINQWHTCPAHGPIRASNPCSEFMFIDDSACNLASLNLVSFLNSHGEFDVEGYLHAIRILIMAQEILVDMSGYPTEAIARNSHDLRPLGLGYANLGGLLMRLGLAYDSDEGRMWAQGLTSVMTAQAYLVSTELAQVLGPFKGFKANKESMLRVIEQHCAAAQEVKADQLAAQVLVELAQSLWNSSYEIGSRVGFRNAQVTAIAPTGTIGLLMDCDTTGMEPDFSLVKYKKMVGGGFVKIVNQSVAEAIKCLGYSAREQEAMLKYLGEHETLEGCRHLRPEHAAVFDCAQRCGQRGKRVISIGGHLRMMAAIQPFVSGALSKTVNLPEDTTVEQIEALYLEAWRLGLKSVSVYRNGSKYAQPLTTSKDDELDLWLKASRVEAPECSYCGHQTVRSGTCFKCLHCGHSESCG